LEVEEEVDDDVIDFTKKANDIEVVANVLDITQFSIHTTLKKLPYDKIKAFNDKVQNTKDGRAIVDMLSKMMPEMVSAEANPSVVRHTCETQHMFRREGSATVLGVRVRVCREGVATEFRRERVATFCREGIATALLVDV